MRQNISLKKVLDALNGLKQTSHGKTNASVNQKLDEAILLVRQCIKDGREDTDASYKVLSAIGKVLGALSSIAALMKLLSD